jgi:hypothetical protein
MLQVLKFCIFVTFAVNPTTVLGRPSGNDQDKQPYEEVGVDPDTLDEEMGIVVNATGRENNNGGQNQKPPVNPNANEIPLQTRGLYLYPKDSLLWPGGRVYYRYEAYDRRQTFDDDAKRRIKIAMDSITEATDGCITFIEDVFGWLRTGVIIYRRTDRQFDMAKRRYEYVESCFSECLGQCRGKMQQLVATPGNCDNTPGNFAGSVVHEILHALGFGHEFQRNDRDNYFLIDDTKWVGFYDTFTVLEDDTKDIAFNFKSIMNYDFGSAVSEKPDAEPPPLGNVKNMGQECRISAGDRNLIERTYAPQCRQNRQPKHTYTKDFPIPGTDCAVKIDASDVDIGPQ